METVEQKESPELNRNEPHLVGVRGWLLYLCVMLTVLTPLILVGGDLSRLGRTMSLVKEGSPWVPYVVFGYGIDALRVGFSIFAGVGLWTLRRNAVRIAEVYFLTLPLYPVSTWLVGMVILRNSPQVHWSHLFQGIGASIVWVSYLENSRRVENTYGLLSQRYDSVMTRANFIRGEQE